MTEKELMMIKRDLQRRAKKKGFGKKRAGAYVFGTLRRVRGNPKSCSEVYDDNWDDREMILVTEKGLKPVCVGQKLKDFRGDTAVLEGGRAPHKEGSSGKVWVKERGSASTREYYPNVFGLKWVPSVNIFPIDKVTREPRYKLRGNPSCAFRSLLANGGKIKTWKLGEYASGGIIQAKVSRDGNAVAIRVMDYFTKEVLDDSLFRWPMDRDRLEMHLNELTTSYYSNVILDWIKSVA